MAAKQGFLSTILNSDAVRTKVSVRHSSGVGTVAAVAALAATLFRPQINIHNLL